MNMEILSDVLGMTSFLATVLLYMSIEVEGIISLMKDRKKLFYIKEQYKKNKQSKYIWKSRAVMANFSSHNSQKYSVTFLKR